MSRVVDLGGGAPPALAQLTLPHWSQRERHLRVHQLLTLAIRAAPALQQPTADGLRVADHGRHVLLHFREPVLAVAVEAAESPPAGVTPTVAFHHSHRIAAVPTIRRTVIECPGITDVLVPTAVAHIRRISFVTERAVSEALRRGRGNQVAERMLPTTAAAAFTLLDAPSGIENRMLTADSLAMAHSKYPPVEVTRLVQHMLETVNDPQLTVTGKAPPGQTPIEVSVLDQLNIAALDPNIARMLALYWVDPEPAAGLYLVSGRYNRPDMKTVDGFAFSADPASLPVVGDPVRAEQLPGISYRGQEPRGRVGLSWRPDDDPKSSRPTFFDVDRKVGGGVERLTEQRPHLVNARGKRAYTDSDVALGEPTQYRITPIDVFGRSGEPRESNVLTSEDLAAPVPPKYVRARLNQPGAPWSVPALRDPATINAAAIETTAEFGEAQHRASPDVKVLKWLWRPGARTPDLLKPAAWRALGIVNVEPPVPAALVWTAGLSPSEFTVPVAAVRHVAPTDVTTLTNRIDAAIPDVSERVPMTDGTVELLLDCPLLQPGLFAGFELAHGTESWVVLSSTAGIAAGVDPHGERRMTARLILPASAAATAIRPKDQVTLRQPDLSGWSLSEVRNMLRSGAEAQFSAAPLVRVRIPREGVVRGQNRASGGEVAVDFHHVLVPLSTGTGHDVVPVEPPHPDRRTAIMTGRVVAETGGDDGALDVLLRVRGGDALRIMLVHRLGVPRTTTVRHHPPYALPRVSIGLSGTPGTIPLDLRPDQRFETLWISAIAVDTDGLPSTQVATPAETRVVNPPPSVTPTAPYPEREGRAAARGLAAPAAIDGASAIALAWDPLPDPHGFAVRFELGRALDSSIVAADRSRWLRGSDVHFAVSGVERGATVTGTLVGNWVPTPNGRSFTVKVAAADDPAALLTVGTGRIRIAHRIAGSEVALHHRLVRVAGGDGTPIALLCQPNVELTETALGTIMERATFRVDAFPDYTEALADDKKLRALANVGPADNDPKSAADTNETAFGVVTGTPVESLRFVDRIPGRGVSRFLYKVRAVFPGEIRSAWSPCSVPVTAPDLTPAPPPRMLRAERVGTLTRHIVEITVKPGVEGIRLLRGATQQPWRVHLLNDLTPARIRARDGRVDLAQVAPGRLTPDAAPRLLGLFDAAVDRDNPPSENLGTGARLVRNMVEPAPGKDLGDRPLAARIELADGRVIWVDQLPGRHEIEIADADGEAVWMQTMRAAVVGAHVVRCDSAAVLLRAGTDTDG